MTAHLPITAPPGERPVLSRWDSIGQVRSREPAQRGSMVHERASGCVRAVGCGSCATPKALAPERAAALPSVRASLYYPSLVTPAFLAAVNVAYFVALQATAGQVVSGIGALVALVLVAAGRVPTIASRLEGEFPRARSGAFAACVAAFAIPALGAIRPVRLVVVTLDVRLLLVLAWLVTLAVLLASAYRRGAASGPRGRIIATISRPDGAIRLLDSHLLARGRMGRGTGHRGYGSTSGGSADGDVPAVGKPSTFGASLLGLADPEAFAHRAAYGHHLHPYLFAMYGAAKLVQIATGQPLALGRNLMVFAFGRLGTGVVAVWMLSSGRARAKRHSSSTRLCS